MSDGAIHYEHFVRQAFGLVQGGKMIERGSDPAGLADADVLGVERLRVGAGYAFEIFRRDIMNGPKAPKDDAERERINGFFGRIVNAKSVPALDKVIGEVRETVLRRYYE